MEISKTNPKTSIYCHIDTDKRDHVFVGVEAMTAWLLTKYGLSMREQVQYKYNGSSYDILVKSKLGDTMRLVGFYYTLSY